MQKATVIVPLIPEHDREIHQLMRYLKSQEKHVTELIVCRSETPEQRHAEVLGKYTKWAVKLDLSFSIELNSTSTKAYDGTNRNRGIEKAKSDILICLDADDAYAENMIETIISTFETTNCDVILHNFTYNKNEIDLDKNEEIKLQELTYPESASLLDFGTPIRTTLDSKEPQIHHAHVSFRKSRVQERYTDIFPGADTEFCKRLIRNGKKTLYIDKKISFWNRKRSLRYKLRLAKIKFGLKK